MRTNQKANSLLQDSQLSSMIPFPMTRSIMLSENCSSSQLTKEYCLPVSYRYQNFLSIWTNFSVLLQQIGNWQTVTFNKIYKSVLEEKWSQQQRSADEVHICFLSHTPTKLNWVCIRFELTWLKCQIHTSSALFCISIQILSTNNICTDSGKWILFTE